MAIKFQVENAQLHKSFIFETADPQVIDRWMEEVTSILSSIAPSLSELQGKNIRDDAPPDVMLNEEGKPMFNKDGDFIVVL